jgi:hypothetical protein
MTGWWTCSVPSNERKMPIRPYSCPDDPYTDYWRYRTTKHGFVAWEDWHFVFGIGPMPFDSNFGNP